MNTGAAVQMRLQRAQALAHQGDLLGALAVLEQATPGERAGVQSFQVDLLKALDSGKLKGAMLDVYSREPLPAESPLWAHPRVAMTPHVAAVTRPAEAVAYISHTISEMEKGNAVTGQVDRQRGY